MRRPSIRIGNFEFKTKIIKGNVKEPKVILLEKNILFKVNNEEEQKLLEKGIKNKLRRYGIHKIRSSYLYYPIVFGKPTRKKYNIKTLENELKKYLNFKVKSLSKRFLNFVPKINIFYKGKKWAYLKNENLYVNFFLIALPKKLIDYILTHEILHFYFKSHDRIFNFILNNLTSERKLLERELFKFNLILAFNRYFSNLKIKKN